MIVSQRMGRFEIQLKNNECENYVYDDGIIKAFMTIGACRDEDKASSFELWGIYVEPLMKRHGIGAALVKYCEKRAIEQGYTEICLWVLEKNDDSKYFYEKMGFIADGTNKYLENLGVTEVRYCKTL